MSTVSHRFDDEFESIDFTLEKNLCDEYEDCVFLRCSFAEVELSNKKFISCRFEGCNFTGATLYETIFRDAVFNGCKLLGLQFSRCNEYGFSAEFNGCNLDLADFSRRTMKKTRFHGCRLHSADFTDTDLKESNFINSDLGSARFERTNLEKVDFTGAFNLILDPALNKMKGAKIPLTELPGLLYMHKIEVITE